MRGAVLAFPDQDRSHTYSVRDRPPQLCIDRKAGRHSPQPREWLRPPLQGLPIFYMCKKGYNQIDEEARRKNLESTYPLKYLRETTLKGTVKYRRCLEMIVTPGAFEIPNPSLSPKGLHFN
ncbi:hypothetical protein L2E82_53459 [Cichorium intybus]|nr:hypothetical protein L2E82_53459 [Cichorium intybus]